MLRQFFRPEFLNRIDDVIVFDNLNEEQVREIAGLQLARVTQRLAAKDITLSITDAAKKLIAKEGFDPAFGARPLKRFIQNAILDDLSLQIVEGKIVEGDTVTGEEAEKKIVVVKN